jgi:hypothetical protein
MYPGPSNVYQQQQAQYQIPQGGNYPGRPSMPQPNIPSSFPPQTAANNSIYPAYSRPYGGNFNPLPPPQPMMQNQGSLYQMPLGVTPPIQPYYPEPKNAPYGGSYQDYNYPASYPPQTGYAAQPASYPPAPTQPGSYLSSAPANYPPNPAGQRPPSSKAQQSDFPVNPRDQKRQSPEFTPKLGISPLHQQRQYYP